MKLLLIRHGDPDYSIDSLTEKGWREAEMLSERIAPMDIKAYYVSPLGRARDTASLTLKKAGREAEILPWAREYNTRIPNGNGGTRVPWDMLPEHWTTIPEYYDKVLKGRGVKDADSSEMLDLINESKTFDASIAYGWSRQFSEVVSSMILAGVTDVSSLIAQYDEMITENIKETMDSIYQD